MVGLQSPPPVLQVNEGRGSPVGDCRLAVQLTPIPQVFKEDEPETVLDNGLPIGLEASGQVPVRGEQKTPVPE